MEIPFIKKVGIQKNSKGLLELAFNDDILNHLQTVHASALFSLAEAASGEALQTYFPDYVGKVIPVVRDSQIKFKHPATSSITAYPSIPDENVSKFIEQFSRKGRAAISVGVEVKDTAGAIICIGTFNWFVQRVKT